MGRGGLRNQAENNPRNTLFFYVSGCVFPETHIIYVYNLMEYCTIFRLRLLYMCILLDEDSVVEKNLRHTLMGRLLRSSFLYGILYGPLYVASVSTTVLKITKHY